MSKTFQKSVDTLDSFIEDEQWLSSILVEVALNPDYERWIVKTIKELNQNMPKGSDLEAFLLNIRKRCLSLLEKSSKGTSIFERWRIARLAYSHYAFLETIIEASTFSDSVINQIRDKLGADYLKTIAEVDRLQPSELTKAQAKIASSRLSEDILHNPEIADYLILKKWQDDQHIFHDKVLDPVFAQTRDEFSQWMYQKYPETKNVKGMALITLGMVANKRIVKLDDIARLVLAKIDDELLCLIGGKGLGLARLVALGANVPTGFIITTSSLRQDDYKSSLKTLPPNQLWSVRSSATIEDGLKHSFAGMFESYLGVATNNLTKSIEKVVASNSSERVKAYVSHFQTETPQMAVVIQKFQTPSASGVWIGHDTSSGTLEWTEGTGDRLVLGRVKPHTETWNKEVHPENPISSTAGPVGLEAIKLQKELGLPADFEWCIIEKKLYWLQYRPVTSKILHNSNNLANGLSGTPASPGIAIGRARVVYDPDEVELGSWDHDDILITEFTDPDWVPIMVKARAVVTAEGGFLSHAAIIARELDIPCVTGVQEALGIKNNSQIKVDGSNGVITLINKPLA